MANWRKQDDAETPAPKWNMEQLRGIVAAGMSVGEARALLEDGYDAASVLELAQLQASQRASEAAQAQTATAKAMQKAMRPENEQHPGISAFSYPEGDVARPRPALAYELYWNGYPIHKFPETEHWRELELMTQIQPGEFTVLCKDMGKLDIAVKAMKNADGTTTRMDVEFKVARERKDHIPPKTVIVHQMLHQDNIRKAFLEGMQEHLTLLMGDVTVPVAV